MPLGKLFKLALAVTRAILPNQQYDFNVAAATILDNITGGTQGGVRYVNKLGSDATGDGSFDKPFLTIQAAVTSIATASAAAPFKVDVGPGVYAESFVLQPWIFLVGAGPGATVLQNPAGNWVGAGFAAAGSQRGGVRDCTLELHDLVVDFSASSVSARFYFYDSALDGVGWTVTGAGVDTQEFFAKNIQQIESLVVPTATATNIRITLSAVDFTNTDCHCTNTAAFTMVCRLDMVALGRAVTLTCSDTTNLLSVAGHFFATISTPIIVVGSGVTLLGRTLVFAQVLPDADVTLSFTTPLTAGALVCANEGLNLVSMTPSVDRTVTVNNSNPTTRLRILNTSPTFLIKLAGPGVPATQTYIPPGGVWDGWRHSGPPMVPTTLNIPQFGTGVLVNGVSALIPADIAAGSSVDAIATNLNASAAIGVLVALDADKVPGTRAGGGGFVIRSLSPAGAAVVTDQSSFRWTVVRGD